MADTHGAFGVDSHEMQNTVGVDSQSTGITPVISSETAIWLMQTSHASGCIQQVL
jgi:hypothetical protein